MSNHKLQILMPMGGLGSRFSTAGYTTPKPLITVDDKPMFLRALDSFAPVEDVKHLFVIRKEHNERYELKEQILKLLPNAKVHVIDHDTRGAVETCLLISEEIDDNTPIAIADCDIYFESKNYFNRIGDESIDGMLLTFESNDPRYSYVEIDTRGKAIRTKEKAVISNNAILGGYYFKNGALFKKLANKFVSNELSDNLKEYYVSHLFNILIESGGHVAISPIDKKYIFGTPEELDAYMSGNG